MNSTSPLNRSKVALVTGITGQDGYYLSRLLLSHGYQVHGIVRRSSSINRGRIDQLMEEMPEKAANVTLHYGDLTDAAGVFRTVSDVGPDEIYNLGAQSHVRVSFDKPQYTEQVNANGALNVLEAARSLHKRKPVRVYQASTSEMFGGLPDTAPQNEQTPFHPRSPYGSAKVSAFHHTVNYRESYDLFACNGILFNHESPHRGETFVTRKVTIAAARIKEGLQSELVMGNLDSKRDWGFAGDYVEAMWLMLQQDSPEDFVIATGISYTVRDFLERAFEAVELSWQDYVRIDPKYFRPAEVHVLCGDAAKAREKLGWVPKTTLSALVRMMVQSDQKLARRERILREAEASIDATNAIDEKLKAA